MKRAAELYRQLQQTHVSWIANVFISCSKPTQRLQWLADALAQGHEISEQSFMMPYEGFRLDGICVRGEISLAKGPGCFQAQQYRYNTGENR